MAKPKHKPPHTQMHHPQLVLMAFNLLIESTKSTALPTQFTDWVRTEILNAATKKTSRENETKRAA